MSALEFDLIDRLRRGLAALPADPGTRVGIGDDAAVLSAAGPLAIAVDTLVEGVHFPNATAPAVLGWKALAVNLSDLAAMGARPRWALLALTVPSVDADFIDAFCSGWAELATAHRVELVGGDTTRGPLAISVTLLGDAPAQPLRRNGARVGDDIYISGVCGEAAAGLALVQKRLHLADPQATAQLIEALQRPQPRVALGQALVGIASAAIDVSDGLLADLGHILSQSGPERSLGADIDCDQLPSSTALNLAAADAEQRREWQLAGGDDYELLFCAAPARRDAVLAAAAGAGTPVQQIGRCTANGVQLRHNGRIIAPPRSGWEHFE
jgi:thiamine-monophosphate kinase